MTTANPLELFKTHFELAQNCGLIEPTSVILATCDDQGNPSARVMLIKIIDQRGLIFFTNLSSRKAEELRRGKAALCFHHMPLHSQIRIEGIVEQVDDQLADSYFASRDRNSQIGAWASKQSQIMSNPAELKQIFDEFSHKFADQKIARPPFWSGFRLVPNYYEFWKEGEHRLHTRTIYKQKGNLWEIDYLFP